MDVSPTSVNREHPVRVAQRIQQRVEELGVTCSIGVGTSKTVAKIASDMDKPRGLTVVYPGGERDFLAPLPVRTMSGIGAAAEEKLQMCIRDSRHPAQGGRRRGHRRRAAGRQGARDPPLG